MKKNKKILLTILIILIIITISIIIIYKTSNKNKTQIINNESNIIIDKKKELESFLINTGKELYDDIELKVETEVILNLDDIKEKYEKDISKYINEPYNCSSEHTYIKIVVLEKSKDYIPVLNCPDL